MLSKSDQFYLLIVARSLQGIGCGVCLMGPLVIIAKTTSSKFFSFYSGLIMGLGGLGAIVATNPFHFIAKHIGWKDAFFQSSFVILVILLSMLAFSPKKKFSMYSKNK